MKMIFRFVLYAWNFGKSNPHVNDKFTEKALTGLGRKNKIDTIGSTKL